LKTPPQNGHLARSKQAWLPNRDQLAQHPWLKPWAARLRDTQLWRFQHESVARGVAVGCLWAFLIPVAQIVAAVVHCVWWRAHIPTAAAMTMVTNPFTIGFWLWLAYQTGSAVLGVTTPAPAGLENLNWDLLIAYGSPIMLGMVLFALSSAAAGYGVVKVGWMLRVAWLRRHRRS